MWFAANFMRGLAPGPLRIEQRVVFVTIAVRPTIHGDGFDVSRRIEAARGQAASDLITDGAFESLEGGDEKLQAAGFVLFARREAGLARRATHVHKDWQFW